MQLKNRFLKKENIPIITVLFCALVLRLLILVCYGPEYNLGSDDVGYVNAAVRFCETGEITMHGIISAQIMPGMIWLLSPLIFLFGTGKGLWITLKLLWIGMSIASIYGVYKIVKLYAENKFAVLASAFFLALDFAWMDNLILTETPFMFSFIYMIYASLKLAETQRKKYFYMVCVYYMIALLMKATIAPVPLLLFIYLWLKKYDMKLMFKQMGIAALIVLAFIIPWSVRNYIRFEHHFIPLTYGAGNPKLLGSYQGNSTPNDESLDYEKNVYSKMSNEMRRYFNQDGTLKEEYQGDNWYKKDNYMAAYYNLKLDGMKADYRLKVWRKDATKDYIISILFKKPLVMIFNSFYWKDVFGIPITVNYVFRVVDLFLCIIGTIGVFLNRRRWKEYFFIVSVYLFQIYVYSFTFVFSRYAQTLYFLRFIIIGWGVYELYCHMCRKVKQDEGICDMEKASKNEKI